MVTFCVDQLKIYNFGVQSHIASFVDVFWSLSKDKLNANRLVDLLARVLESTISSVSLETLVHFMAKQLVLPRTFSLNEFGFITF